VKACRTGSAIGALGTLAVLAFGACRVEKPHAEIPAVTSATPDPNRPLLSGPSTAATLTTDAPPPIEAGAAQPLSPNEPPVTARFVTSPGRVDIGGCGRHIVLAVARGKITAFGQTLAPGDSVDAWNVDAFDAKGQGLAVLVTRGRASDAPCPNPDAGPGQSVTHFHGAEKLVWAGGKMSARLDYRSPRPRQSDLYLGRLEGTAAVPEHTHDASWEIVAAVEASGTISLDGKEQRLGPRQIVVVPPGTKHAWKPDPGTKLVAIQMYSPPGPEQRFIALAAADKDGGVPPAAPDAGKR
jgi:mannose-6-phosphate isomerase-like protein (cupin superfamily)